MKHPFLYDLVRRYGFENPKSAMDKMGVTPATFSEWSRDGIPARRVLEIEKKTGIPREELCPALFKRCA